MSEQHELSNAAAPVHPGAPRPFRFLAIWLLAAASLAPGLVAVVAREFFHGLPYAFRVTVYVLSGLMMAAVVLLIVTRKESA
ncbi:MAG TPA: hypothetical protein VJQ44_05635 [Gemmatimonadales bacterium]|nr:hypothetical protein [Gemmatimonadales bacterium]